MINASGDFVRVFAPKSQAEVSGSEAVEMFSCLIWFCLYSCTDPDTVVVNKMAYVILKWILSSLYKMAMHFLIMDFDICGLCSSLFKKCPDINILLLSKFLISHLLVNQAELRVLQKYMNLIMLV